MIACYLQESKNNLFQLEFTADVRGSARSSSPRDVVVVSHLREEEAAEQSFGFAFFSLTCGLELAEMSFICRAAVLFSEVR